MTPSTPVYAGRFHQGRIAEGNRPQALDTWRVTTDDAQVAARIADLHGGQLSPNGGSGKRAYEILTARESVRILMDGPDAVSARMVLWSSKGKIHECDGVVFLSPADVKGRPCGCPLLVEDRKALAKEGRGPQPTIELTFRLMAAPSLGKFQFHTGSWEAAKRLPQLAEELDAVEGPAVCDFTTELVTLTATSGTPVAYRRPVVTVLGSPDTVVPEPPPAVPSTPVLMETASRRRTPRLRPPSPMPATAEPTCSIDLDVTLLDRAARALGTTSHQETVIAALTQALQSQQRAVKLDQLRECVQHIATTAEQALRADDSSPA
ncbi:hypothetical protein [Streptomyces sp. L-9-10]|uniref:recombination directionality factor n=1 Tax=Streptomyces sp. L-9-10 TaxID=1478131 RepID=UPI00101E05E1|nr:hypothetical protein [Streptomyces sp. L-9-10]